MDPFFRPNVPRTVCSVKSISLRYTERRLQSGICNGYSASYDKVRPYRLSVDTLINLFSQLIYTLVILLPEFTYTLTNFYHLTYTLINLHSGRMYAYINLRSELFYSYINLLPEHTYLSINLLSELMPS